MYSNVGGGGAHGELPQGELETVNSSIFRAALSFDKATFLCSAAGGGGHGELPQVEAADCLKLFLFEGFGRLYRADT